MKEHPILFSTPMVQAILEGRKTQTRRIVKFPEYDYPNNWEGGKIENGKKALFYNTANDRYFDAKCQYGQPGDLLWVRETFVQVLEEYAFKAEYSTPVLKQMSKGMWKPSIHLPKAAARIWLEITEVKVERLQDISEEDAVAEGIEPLLMDVKKYGWRFKDYMRNSACLPKASYQTLWQKINGPESWKANPWVWVVKFKMLSTTGKPNMIK